jgi:hypothetical protein
MRRTIGAACLAACTTIAMPAAAWDFPGHRIVGAIADLVLLQHYPAAQQRVSELLEKRDGTTIEKRTLSQVSVFPDCAKRGNVPFCGRSPSDEEKAYVERNRHHDKFHFTDVPLQQPTYRPGSAGTEDIDVVQMIAYAVDQLRGKHPPTKSDVNLTDTEAVWLLAHLVGDIHQPLHVGAKYFDKTCQTSLDPNIAGTPPTFGIGDTVAMTMGGNLILLTTMPPAVPPIANLHLYWDSVAVLRAMQAAGSAHSEQDFAKLLATTPPPPGWETGGSVETWAAQWASEIMPLAVEAHERLSIRKGAKPSPFTFTGGCTWEATLDPAYEDWAKAQAQVQLAKAGFRLAALFKAIFQP